MGVVLIYQSNAGPAVYGPFPNVSAAVAWARAHEFAPFQIATLYAPRPTPAAPETGADYD